MYGIYCMRQKKKNRISLGENVLEPINIYGVFSRPAHLSASVKVSGFLGLNYTLCLHV